MMSKSLAQAKRPGTLDMLYLSRDLVNLVKRTLLLRAPWYATGREGGREEKERKKQCVGIVGGIRRVKTEI